MRFRTRRKLVLKSFSFLIFLYFALALITRQLRPLLIIRDVGYLTRPIWDSPGAQPEIIIPHFHTDTLPYEELCALHGWTLRSEENKVSQVIDAVIFSVELDLLEIRIRELWEVVDIFLVLEANRTLTGKPKPLVLQENLHRFKWAEEKLRPIASTKELQEHPKKEFDNEIIMRVEMKKAVTSLRLSMGDIVIVSDVDEIPFKHTIQLIRQCKGYTNELHLQMRNYIYSFEFYKDTTNWKPHVQLYDRSFVYHHSKRDSKYQLADAGWHCSFCFRYLSDFVFKMTSYSHNDRVTGQHLLKKEVIQKKICEGADIFEMLPEAYSYQELISVMGNVPRTLSTLGIPQTVVNNYNKFRFLLPGGCIREDAPNQFLQTSLDEKHQKEQGQD